jgi:hypothetical protein
MVLEPEVVMVYLAALVENDAEGWLYWPVFIAGAMDLAQLVNGGKHE